MVEQGANDKFFRPSGACDVGGTIPTADAVGYHLTALRACMARKRADPRQHRKRGKKPEVVADPMRVAS